MQRSSKATIAILFILTLACTLPEAAAQPILASDENSLSTMIAGTAAELATQTAWALPTGAGANKTPTETATATPNASVSAYGSSLVKQADGSTLFTDFWSGYQVIIPAGWVVIRPNHEEYYRVWSDEAIAHPELTAEMEVIEGQDPRLMRLHAFDLQPDHQQQKYVAHIYIMAITDREVNLEEDIRIAIQSEQQKDPKLKLLAAGTGSLTSTNIPILKLEYEEAALNMRYEEINVHDQRIYFHGRQGSVNISLSTLSEVKAALLPTFEAMIDGMILLP